MGKTLDNPDALEAKLYQPAGNVSPIPYPPSREDHRYMDMALEEAQLALDEGNVAIGAVFVATLGHETKVWRAHSTEITENDLDAHAERNAYKQCQPVLGRDLSPVVAYVTSEPCRGCGNRFAQGRVGKLIYGADYNDAPGFFRSRETGLDTMLRDAGRTILVVPGFKKDEALGLMIPANKVH
jgi:tRNA(Arg) A34 adenosine deaminase TadA